MNATSTMIGKEKVLKAIALMEEAKANGDLRLVFDDGRLVRIVTTVSQKVLDR